VIYSLSVCSRVCFLPVGKVWETKVSGNHLSFEEVYNGNTEACPTTLESVIYNAHNDIWGSISEKIKK
jgi:hypothetical protein